MSIDILIVVSTSDAEELLAPMFAAVARTGCSVAVFLTNDGVKIASRERMGIELAGLDDAVVCSESWSRFSPQEPCLLTLGSQTDHSMLVGRAGKIISL